MQTSIKVKRLAHAEGLALPRRMSDHASGFDIVAACDESLTLRPGQRSLIPTGLSFEIAPGYEVQIRPRSGLASKHGVTVLNAPGTIDADYRGEVKVLLINLGEAPCTIHRGDRIAQAVPAAVASSCVFQEVETLSETTRGTGGFGHTGAA
jgi:dUTP pyrophosphatase